MHYRTPGKDNLLRNIILAIILAILIGGFFPDFGSGFAVLGKIFLNSLMMLVVPLVMCSMIVGITGLGDIRKLGKIGSRTIIYYLITTGLSVFVGLVLVNLIRPGQDVTTGEIHSDYSYELSGDRLQTVSLIGQNWDRTSYSDKYVIILEDQQVKGEIRQICNNKLEVKYWQPASKKGLVLIRTETGETLPFKKADGRLVSAVPELHPSGKSIKITLPEFSALNQNEKQSILETLKAMLIGDPGRGNEGMIPRNIFNAMLNMDILPLIFFSLLIGAALTIAGPSTEQAIAVFEGLNNAIMQIIKWLMQVAPIGIFGLIASRIGLAGGFRGFLPELSALGKYAVCVIGGLLFHAIIILPLILKLFSRQNPAKFAAGMAGALFNAFSTASSSATLPLTINCAEKQNGISNRTASFVLPLGATVNMDGTALYEAVAAMFIAQVYGIPMNPAQQIIIFLTATLAAIGAAGIPQAGLVTMVIVLKAVNLPVEGIGLILTIDWLLDRFRTTVNVWGDSVGAAVIDEAMNH